MSLTETVLAEIDQCPGATCEQIADCLEVEKKDITYAITRLLRRELIKHYRPPHGPMQYFLKAYVAPVVLVKPKDTYVFLKVPHRSSTTGTFVPTKWESPRAGAEYAASIPSRVGDKLVPYTPPVSMSRSFAFAAFTPSRFQS